MANCAFITRMLACGLLAGLLDGCSGHGDDLVVGDPDPLKTLRCGYYQASTHHAPDGWPCWVMDPGRCIVTAQAANACTVPERSDALFAEGDRIEMWCPVGVNEAGERELHAVQCATGERVN